MKYSNLCVALLATAFSANYNTASAQSAVGANHAVPGHYMPWKPIAMKDLTNHRRVWEDINISEKNNSIFAKHKTGIALADALVNGVMDAKIIPYSNVDDRFTTKLTPEEFSAISEKISNNNTHITRFIIKEDSLFINTGEVTVRIIGIAPVGYTIGVDGVIKEQPLFWVFYPDCRVYLSQYMAEGSYSWDDILERRNFTGIVTKTHDHYLDKQLQKQ